MNAVSSIAPPTAPPRRPNAKGFTDHQLAALGELCKLAQRAELVVQIRGGLDGSAIATVRDRWAVEHFNISPDGVITRPVTAGRRPTGAA